ncbi:MAG: hypothetical protein ACOYL6_06250 [Bacteriovoracaceae bacterium]
MKKLLMIGLLTLASAHNSYAQETVSQATLSRIEGGEAVLIVTGKIAKILFSNIDSHYEAVFGGGNPIFRRGKSYQCVLDKTITDDSKYSCSFMIVSAKDAAIYNNPNIVIPE